MRSRTLIVSLAAAMLLLLAGAAWWLRPSRGYALARTAQERLESSVAAGAQSFDFASDGFAWDRVHVFGPYSPQKDVERSLGFAWPDFHRTTIESSDSVCLVVFVRDGSVIDWYEQSRKVDLSWLASGEGYTRPSANFRIDRSGQPVSLTQWASTKR